MDNQAVLERAIKLAIDGGWLPKTADNMQDLIKSTGMEISVEMKQQLIDVLKDTDYVKEIIFDHDFARALWGEFKRTSTVSTNGHRLVTIENKGWKHYLQQMVIADDPIAYLGQNL